MRRRTFAAAAVALAASAPPAAATPAPEGRPSLDPTGPTRTRAWIANLVAPTPIRQHPRANGQARWLRPTGRWTGGPVGLLVVRARPGWVKVLLPNRPNGAAAWIPSDRVLLTRTRWRVRVDVSSRRVAVLHNGRPVHRFGAVVGAPSTPTPVGTFAVYEIDMQPDPFGFLGPAALHLTAHSDVLDNYGGGAGRVAIHGRGGASLLVPLGSAASHGCIRIDSDRAEWLARKLPPGAPVMVVR
jgi:lipoprotein-anchoring transpeptidase ErfK/SrfK